MSLGLLDNSKKAFLELACSLAKNHVLFYSKCTKGNMCFTHKAWQSLMLSFPCTKCGVCCKNISHIEALRDFNLGNGTCKFLDVDSNTCKIYHNRPEICNIDSMYEKYYIHFIQRKNL